MWEFRPKALFFTVALIFAGCSIQPELSLGSNALTGAPADAGAQSLGDGSVSDAGADAACSINNLTRRCECREDGETASGRQICSPQSGWGLCQCKAFPDTFTYVHFIGGPFDLPSENKGDAGFGWQQTVPQLDKCQPGTYVGTYTCLFVPIPPDGGVPLIGSVQMGGTVTITLAQSASGESLEITDGTIGGDALIVYLFEAALSGKLNCSTDTFKAAASEGTYQDLSGVFVGGMFDGTLRAAYDIHTQILTGSWTMEVGPPYAGTCEGPWIAALRQ
jgi:hypothetical protein